MRWLLISSQHHASHGGIGAYVSRFVAAAARRGWEITLVTRPGPHISESAATHEIQTFDHLPAFAQYVPRLRQLHRIRPYRYALWSRAVAECLLHLNGDFDAIEFVDCQAEGCVSLLDATVRERWSNTPMFVHAHTPMYVEEQLNALDMRQFGRPIYHEWERRAISAADCVCCATHALLRRLPLVKNSTVIPLPIESRLDIQNQGARRNATVGDSQMILVVGTASRRKGIDLWAQSLNIVFERLPRVVAVLIGSDTPTAPTGTSMVEHVTNLIDGRFRHRFHWLGPRSPLEVRARMLESSLLVVPSLFESFSMVTAEAIEINLPVLVSTAVGLSEYIPEISKFEAGDVESLAAGQVEMLEYESEYRRTAPHLRERLLSACDPARVLQQRGSLIAAVGSASVERSQAYEDVLGSIEEFIAATEHEAGIVASTARS